MIILRVMEGRAVTSETWSGAPISFQSNPSSIISSTDFSTFRGSSTKINTDFNTSSFARSSRTCVSLLEDVKHKFASPVSKRPDLRVLTQLWPPSICDDGELGYMKTLPYVDGNSSPSESISSLSPSPQTLPIALTPRHIFPDPCLCVYERSRC